MVRRPNWTFLVPCRIRRGSKRPCVPCCTVKGRMRSQSLCERALCQQKTKEKKKNNNNKQKQKQTRKDTNKNTQQRRNRKRKRRKNMDSHTQEQMGNVSGGARIGNRIQIGLETNTGNRILNNDWFGNRILIGLETED